MLLLGCFFLFAIYFFFFFSFFFNKKRYSHIAVGGRGSDMDVVAEPEGAQLFFAGEHTSRPFTGMVNGAIWSGLTAAHDAHDALTGRSVTASLATLTDLLVTGSYTPRPLPPAAAQQSVYRLDRAAGRSDESYRAWRRARNFENLAHDDGADDG